jgi:hypothetical protein
VALPEVWVAGSRLILGLVVPQEEWAGCQGHLVVARGRWAQGQAAVVFSRRKREQEMCNWNERGTRGG